jgi:phage terminase Nu1 subunit (DNA packaging protein)
VERSGGGYRRPEPWVTKRQLAEHLKVTVRWIETQHHLGLPYVRRGGVVRYRISEVEAWLRRMSGA